MTLLDIKYPKIEFEGYDSREIQDILSNVEIVGEVKKLLLEDKRVQKLMGTQIEQGHFSMLFSIDLLSKWFVWRAVSVGAMQAIEDLDIYLDTNRIQVTCNLWILGIDVDNIINLFEDVTLVPFNLMATSFVKDSISASKYGSIISNLPIPYCALVSSCQEDDKDKIKETRQKLYDITMLLNLINGASCMPYMSNLSRADNSPYGPFGALVSQNQNYDIVGDHTIHFFNRDFDELENIYKSFSKLSMKQQKRFSTIINRIRQAKRRYVIEDKILDLVIAMEMMLLDDNDKSQLKLQFRLRGSWLISDNDNARKTNYRVFGKLYDFRSSVAHSGTLREKDLDEIGTNFSTYCGVAEKICKTLLLKGKPNWDELILGISTKDKQG